MTDMPLYPTEAQIARKVLGVGRLDEWKALAVVLERDGLPPVKPLFGGRYWPAVEQWFQTHEGMVSIAPGRFGPPDGVETCPKPREKRQDSSSAHVATVHRLSTGPRDETS